MDGPQVCLFCERITQRGLVVHEEADCFGLQFVQIEPRSEANLHGQVGVLRVRCGAQRFGVGIEPFLNAAFGAEPRGMVMRVVGREARHGRDAQDARGFVRRAAMEIVLGQAAHQTVAPEEATPAPQSWWSCRCCSVPPGRHGGPARMSAERTPRKPEIFRRTMCIRMVPALLLYLTSLARPSLNPSTNSAAFQLPCSCCSTRTHETLHAHEIIVRSSKWFALVNSSGTTCLRPRLSQPVQKLAALSWAGRPNDFCEDQQQIRCLISKGVSPQRERFFLEFRDQTLQCRK